MSVSKKKVYFNLRHSSRERMWDTARVSSSVCEPVFPSVKQKASISRVGKQNWRIKYRKKLRNMAIKYLPLINYQRVDPVAQKADLLYMWGAFPKGCDKSYVVEIENPYVFSYYDPRTIELRMSKIKELLRKSKYITYLCQASYHHSIHLYGEEFRDKSMTFPPFMEANYEKRKVRKKETIDFLFIGMDWVRKGGPYLLEAFSRLQDTNARLKIISSVDDQTKEKYAKDKRITFLPPQPREVLLNDIYPNSDVFVMPSFHESFPIVVLEALSYGLGLIVTDVYGTPELIPKQENGRLLPHPILEPEFFDGYRVVDCNKIHPGIFTKEYADKGIVHHKFVDDIEKALEAGMKDSFIWQEKSTALFKNHYAPSMWEDRMKHILK